MANSFSIAFRPMGNPSELVRLARKAEAVGYHRIWLVEVYESDVLVLASALARSTRMIGICSGVVNLSMRLPFLLAMAAATASDLSNGRFALGVGAGSPPMNYASVPEKDRPLPRLRETLQLLRPLLKGETVNFKGDVFNAEGLSLGVPPSHPVKVYAAAMGTRTVEIAARYADGALLMLPTRRFVRDSKALARETREKYGLSRAGFSMACHMVTSVRKSREEAEEAARSTLAYFVTVDVYRESFKRLGFASQVDEITTEIHRRGQEAAAARVPKDMLDELMVYGTPSDCRDKISAFVSEGIDEPIVYSRGSRPGFPKDIEATISLMRPRPERS